MSMLEDYEFTSDNLLVTEAYDLDQPTIVGEWNINEPWTFSLVDAETQSTVTNQYEKSKNLTEDTNATFTESSTSSIESSTSSTATESSTLSTSTESSTYNLKFKQNQLKQRRTGKSDWFQVPRKIPRRDLLPKQSPFDTSRIATEEEYFHTLDSVELDFVKYVPSSQDIFSDESHLSFSQEAKVISQPKTSQNVQPKIYPERDELFRSRNKSMTLQTRKNFFASGEHSFVDSHSNRSYTDKIRFNYSNMSDKVHSNFEKMHPIERTLITSPAQSVKDRLPEITNADQPILPDEKETNTQGKFLNMFEVSHSLPILTGNLFTSEKQPQVVLQSLQSMNFKHGSNINGNQSSNASITYSNFVGQEPILCDRKQFHLSPPHPTVLSLNGLVKRLKRQKSFKIVPRRIIWELVPVLTEEELVRPVTSSMLEEVAIAVGENWRRLGEEMKLPALILDDIYDTYKPGGLKEVGYQMMKVWQNQLVKTTTVGVLRRHLQNIGVQESKLSQHRIRFFYTNAAGLECKINELRLYAHTVTFDFIAISETHFKRELRDDSVAINGYHLYRTDRHVPPGCSSRGGGVALYITNNAFVSESRSVHDSEGAFELIWCHVHVSGGWQFIACCCYRLCTKTSKHNVSKLLRALSKMVYNAGSLPIYICGDFNFPKIDWELKKAPSGFVSDFLSWTQHHRFRQHVKSFTRYHTHCNPSLLDLILSRNGGDFVHMSLDAPISTSDHCTISAILILKRRTAEMLSRRVYEHDQTDFDTMRLVLYSVSWNCILHGSVDETWNRFKELLLDVAEYSSPVWSSETFHHLMSKLNFWSYNPKSQQYWDKHRKANRALHSSIRKDLFQHAKCVIGNSTLIGKYPATSSRLCFEFVDTTPRGRSTSPEVCMYDAILKSLASTTTYHNGQNNVFHSVFWNCKHQLVMPFKRFFCKCIEEGIPRDWMFAIAPDAINKLQNNREFNLTRMCIEVFTQFLSLTDYFTYCDIICNLTTRKCESKSFE